jgi:hypothetical protein
MMNAAGHTTMRQRKLVFPEGALCGSRYFHENGRFLFRAVPMPLTLETGIAGRIDKR